MLHRPVEFTGQHRTKLRDLKGMKLIQTLLRNPGKEMLASLFVVTGSVQGTDVPDPELKARDYLTEGLPRLDDKYKREVRQVDG